MSEIYESAKLLAEYLLFHFGTPEEILPPERPWPAGMREALDFPVRTVGHFSKSNASRGLDLGCAVGRSTFEMARFCEEVKGIDFSHAFIRAAASLGRGESVEYARQDEGHRQTQLEARAPDHVEISRANFVQGDAMDLPPGLGKFDRVHAANLLCRLPRPDRLLARLPDLVNPGGELVLATPCTWLAEFTPPQNWPPGDTLEWLKSALSGGFELLEVADEPFLIRETGRKFQWTSSMVTVWRRAL